jgi:hypothetical protein
MRWLCVEFEYECMRRALHGTFEVLIQTITAMLALPFKHLKRGENSVGFQFLSSSCSKEYIYINFLSTLN